MRYFIVSYHQTPNGKYNETIKVDKKIRPKYLNTASVIIDYKDRKIIKSRFQGELGSIKDSKDFDTINNFYRAHYPQVISQLEAKYIVLDEIVDGVKAELAAEVEVAVAVAQAAAEDAKVEDGSD